MANQAGKGPPRYLVLLLILLLGTGLRFYRLDAQSFWNDEGNAAGAAQRSIPLILAASAGDIHPPGYYLLLHFWWMVLGKTEWALRALSAFCSLVTVALTYALGRRLLGPGAGFTGGFLAALSPLAVYYSQEARMYALLGLLSALSTYLVLRWLCVPGPRSPTGKCPPHLRPSGLVAAYVLATAAGLYAHYAFLFVLLTHHLIFLGWWIGRLREKGPAGEWLIRWLMVQALVLLLFLPWSRIALRSVSGWPSAGREYPLGLALLDIFRALSVGITLELAQARWTLLVAGGLLLAGLWPSQPSVAGRPGRLAGSVGVLVGWLLVPVALIFALDLYKPTYLKFLLAVLPPLHLLLAHGACRLYGLACRLPVIARRSFFACPLLGVAGGLVVVVLLLPSLRNLYFHPAYARDNYRRIASDIEAQAGPDDAVILNAPNQWEVFVYYFHGPTPLYPAPYHPCPEEVAQWLEPILASHQRLFVLYWGDTEADPERLVEGRLATLAYPAGEHWYGRVRVATYGLGPLPQEPVNPAGARFGSSIRLLGYALDQGAFSPGDVVPVTLFWEATALMPQRYKVFLHLVGAAGNLVAQNDSEPCGNLRPTTGWVPGEMLIDRHGVLLPADLPAGEYTLRVGLYRLDSGERLNVEGDGEPSPDYLTLGSVLVLP